MGWIGTKNLVGQDSGREVFGVFGHLEDLEGNVKAMPFSPCVIMKSKLLCLEIAKIYGFQDVPVNLEFLTINNSHVAP